ncbi:MAG: class I SAM-dependent methyltransferase [Niabella sp.]
MSTEKTNNSFDKTQGHWILAQMGKKVLRPGGKELTIKLISAIDITKTDNVAEFAPGLGFTASLALKHNPKSYIGIDADEDAIKFLKSNLQSKNILFQLGNAANTTLENSSKDKVYGEAMLTMQADHRKSEIIREAHRILKKGGLYGIHELGLINVNNEQKAQIQKDLAQAIKVNARPLTETEWISLLEHEGFTVRKVMANSMSLLETKRIIDDEGFFRTLKIGFNILTHPKARKRIMAMRKIFKKHQKYINAIAIVAEKNEA